MTDEQERARAALERRQRRREGTGVAAAGVEGGARRRRLRASARRVARTWEVAAIALAALLTLAVIYAGDRIPRGVRAVGVGLGGLSRDAAAVRLAQAWQTLPITVTLGEEQWAVPRAQLGLLLDAPATARSAHALGRSPRAIGGALLGRHAIDAPAVWRFDAAVARDGMDMVAQLVDRAPRAVDVRIVAGRAEAAPARDGRAVDPQASLQLLERNAASIVARGVFTPVTHVLPAPAGDPAAALAEANARLARPLRILLVDPVRDETISHLVEPDAWVAWVSVRVDPGDGRRLVWSTDVVRAAEALADLAPRVGDDRQIDARGGAEAVASAIASGRDAVSVRLYHAAARHRVEPGETVVSIAEASGVPFPWIQKVNPGLGDAVWPGDEIVIPSPDLFLPLPVIERKRIVVSIAEQTARVYEDGVLHWEWAVSTGIESSPTSPGVYQVQTHEENAYASNWDLWMPYFLGIYRPLPDSPFMNGFHGFPTRGGRDLLWTGSLGAPVTYGCILLSTDNARMLYDWADDGVVVEIRP